MYRLKFKVIPSFKFIIGKDFIVQMFRESRKNLPIDLLYKIRVYGLALLVLHVEHSLSGVASGGVELGELALQVVGVLQACLPLPTWGSVSDKTRT